MRHILKPQHVKSCDCGHNYVYTEADGISEEFTCAECGTLLADLIVGAEP